MAINTKTHNMMCFMRIALISYYRTKIQLFIPECNLRINDRLKVSELKETEHGLCRLIILRFELHEGLRMEAGRAVLQCLCRFIHIAAVDALPPYLAITHKYLVL